MAMKMNGYTEGRVRKNTSPNKQQKNFSLRVVKTFGNAENCAGCKQDSNWEAIDGNAEGCNQEGTSARNGVG